MDTVPPALTLNPANGATLYTPTPTLNVSYSDGTPGSGLELNTLLIKLDNTDVTAKFTKTAGNASYAISTNEKLTPGQHIFYAKIIDRAGNITETTSTLTAQDNVAPTLNITNPTGGAVLGAAPTAVATYSDTFSGIDTNSFSATLNGTNITSTFTVISSQASTALGSGLNQGQNTLVIQISDLAGNTSTKTVNFTFDSAAPTISSIAPANGSFLKSNTPTIQIAYNDSESGIDTTKCSFFLNGLDRTSAFTVTTTGASLQITAPLPGGLNTVIANIEDRAGNTASQTFSFTVDTLAPTLALTPTEGGVINTPRPTLRIDYSDPSPGSGLDPNTLFVQLDGVDISSRFNKLTDHATFTVPSGEALTEGSHLFLARIQDTAGNIKEVSITFQMVQTVDHFDIEITPASGTVLQADKFHSLKITAKTINNGTATGYTGFIMLNTTDPNSNLNNLLLEFKAENQGVVSFAEFAYFYSAGNHTVTVQDIARENVKGQVTLAVLSDAGNTLVFEEGGQNIIINKGDTPAKTVVAVKDSAGLGVANTPLTWKLSNHADQLLRTDPFGKVTLSYTALNQVGVYGVSISGRGLNTLNYSITVLGPDTTPPVIAITPGDGRYSVYLPVIKVSYSDFSTGVDTETLGITLDGNPITPDTVSTSEATIQITSELIRGPHTLGVTLSDRAGNQALARSTFNVVYPHDTLTPAKINIAPNISLHQVAFPLSNNGNKLQIKVTDHLNHPLYGATVSFEMIQGTGKLATLDGKEIIVPSSPTKELYATTDNDGIATVLYFSPGATGTVIIRARLYGSPLVASIDFTINVLAKDPNITYEITPSTGVVQAGTPFDITITAPIEYTNTVTVSITGLDAPNVSTPPYATGPININFDDETLIVNGVKRATLNNVVILDTGTGSQTITASDFSLGISKTASVAVTPGPATLNSSSMIGGNNQSGPVNTRLKDPFIVQVSDAFGNIIPNRDVTFEVTQGSGFFGTKTDTIATIETKAGGGSGLISLLGPSQINSGGDIAYDIKGDMYIADANNHRIRKVDRASGEIFTIAGTGTPGYSGDGGPAKDAQINRPIAIAVDTDGTIYFSDFANYVIRKIDKSGIISTIAGIPGQSGNTGDGGPATQAKLSLPFGLALYNGKIYIADGYCIRVIDSDNIISTLVKNNQWVYRLKVYTNVVYFSEVSIWSGTPLGIKYFTLGSSTIHTLIPTAGRGLEVDSDGNIYFFAGGQVQKIDSAHPAGFPIAGSGGYGDTGDGGSALSATFKLIASIDKNSITGEVAVLDQDSYRVRGFFEGGNIRTIAGNGTAGYSGDGGLATNAELNFSSLTFMSIPGVSGSNRTLGHTGITVDQYENIYIADSSQHRVLKIDTLGNISIIAGTGVAGYSDGKATESQLKYPSDVAVDQSGNIFIADLGNHRIRKVDTYGNLTTIAGTGSAFDGPDSTPLSTPFGWPSRIVFVPDSADPNQNALYVMTYPWYGSTRIIKKIQNGQVTTTASSDQWNEYSGLSVDQNGMLYIASGSQIFKLSTKTVPSTPVPIGGTSSSGYFGDGGIATLAQFNKPFGISVDLAGRVFIADSENHRIRYIDESGIVNTLAGTGTPGFFGDNGPALSARLNTPTATALDSSGNLLLIDRLNDRLRKITFAPRVRTITVTADSTGKATTPPYITGSSVGQEKVRASLDNGSSVDFNIDVNSADSTPPIVTSTGPTAGASNVRLNIGSIEIKFSEAMEETTLAGKIRLMLGGAEVTTTPSWYWLYRL